MTSERPMRSQELTYQNVLEILDVVKKTGWGDIDIEVDGSRLKVSRSAASVAEPSEGQVEDRVSEKEDLTASGTSPEASSSVAGAGAAAAEIDLTGLEPVLPPMAGIFYSSPSPGAPPFVSPGDRVTKGQQLGIVEVMKLFTPVSAPCAGVVKEVLAINEAFVEKDEIVMVIEPVEE